MSTMTVLSASIVRVVTVLLCLSLLVGCGSTSPTGSQPFDAGGTGHDGMALRRDTGPETGSLHSGDSAVNYGTLSISPASATLTVTNAASPTQLFAASVNIGGSTHTVTADWSLDDYSLGGISSTGTFTPLGTIAGTVTVAAKYGTLNATAKVTVVVHLTGNLANTTLPDGTVISEDSTLITPTNLTALQAAPSQGDTGIPTTLIYPYDKTVFPLGLLAPVAQFSAGSIAPVDFKISLDATGFHWDGFGHVGNPAALQAAIPQNAWDGALGSATSTGATGAVTLSLVKAAAGIAYGPAQSHLVIAKGKLTGVIYYESYSTDAITTDGGASTDFGLWAVKPGLAKPPSHLQPGCVICHAVSAAGSTLTTGTDDPNVGASTGVFRVEADGGYTHLATAPTSLPYQGGGAGPNDTRGLGWATVSPDGKVILRGIGDF